MGELVALNAGPKAAGDLSQVLREYADAVDRGEIVDFCAAYVRDGEYRFLYSASLKDSLIMLTLAQHTSIERFKQ